MLLLVGTDVENSLIPLAASIVHGETAGAWLFFFKHAVQHMPRLNSNEMVIISDRCKGLIDGISAFCPQAHHCYDVVHLLRNISSHYGAPVATSIKPVLWRAAKTLHQASFDVAMDELKKISMEAFSYLMNNPELHPKHWAQYALPVPRYFQLTSNPTESLNGLLLTARHAGPLSVLISLRCWIYSSFGKRLIESDEAIADGEQYPPCVITHLEEESMLGAKYKVVHNQLTSQVIVTNSQLFDIVFTRSEPCSCGMWSSIRLPCSHLIAAASTHSPQIDYRQWIGQVWTWEAQKATFSVNFLPISTVDFSVNDQLDFSQFAPTGSQRKKSIKSTGEAKSLNGQKQQKTLVGHSIGAAAARETYADTLVKTGQVHPISTSQSIVQGYSGTHYSVDREKRTCNCGTAAHGFICAHIQAAEALEPNVNTLELQGFVPTSLLLQDK